MKIRRNFLILLLVVSLIAVALGILIGSSKMIIYHPSMESHRIEQTEK